MTDETSLFDQIADPNYRTRRTDPDTSREAAAAVENITERQAGVLRAFRRSGPMTDRTLVDVYTRLHALFPSLYPKQTESSLRTRRSELVKLGALVDSGEKETLDTGRKAKVWKEA